MTVTSTFTSPTFIVTSALALDVDTVVVNFNYAPILGSGTYTLASIHGEVRTVVQGVGTTPYQIYLHLNAPLTQDFWILTYTGILETVTSTPIVPGTSPFWCGLGVAPTGVPTPPFSGDTLDAAEYIRKQIPVSMKGDVWSCLIAGLAVSEQVGWDNAPLAANQLFLSTAFGEWLDRRMSGVGLERPHDVGMPDASARDYAIQLSNRQQTIPAILEALKVFYGIPALHAGVSSAVESYILIDGQTLTITFDNLTPITITFNQADFSNIGVALAVEICSVLNREFVMQNIKAMALTSVDPTTSRNIFSIYTGTMGARGIIQVTAGAAQAALGLPITFTRLLDSSRAAYVLTRGKCEVDVFMPATTDVVSRNLDSACYLSTDHTFAGVGPYLYEAPGRGVELTGVTNTITSALLAHGQYRLVSVTSSALFSDTEGWVCFGLGQDYYSGPVKYIGKAGATTIIVDPSFTFAYTVPVGAAVNMIVSNQPVQPVLGEDGDMWLTQSAVGRIATQAAVGDIAAAGYETNMRVLYPGDIGLGNAGEPTYGTQRLSDIVSVCAGDEVDVELAEIREGE